MKKIKVVQFLPADGWYAATGYIEVLPVELEFERLAAWAVVENEEGNQEMRGVVPEPSANDGLCFADDVEDGIFAWLEYVHRDDINDDHKELLLNRAKKRQQEFWEFPV